ncbi:MAG: metallophosphoesterase [Oligoflexales bacterium]
MKLHILSDVHNEFSVLEPPETDADVVILAGDIDVNLRAIPWAKRFDKPVIYLLGNHEFYGQHYERIVEETRIQTEGTHIHFLDNDALILDGVRFLGGTLWTDFQAFGQARSIVAMMTCQQMINDFKHITIGSEERHLRPEDTVTMFETTVSFLKAKLMEPFDGKTVVITHHAPSMESVADRFKHDILTPGFASDLTHLMGPDVALWVHGHVHNSSDYVCNGTRVVCNPRGYQNQGASSSENKAFNPALVVEV